MSVMFSIGIPAYKAKYLLECIDSILNQTYQNFELIIVNDCSPENLDIIVESFVDNRISYYTNESNCGAENVVDNWNICLSYAKGDYFILMGDDDIMCENYLYEFEKMITKHPQAQVLHCRSAIIDENSNVLSYTESRPEFESVFDNIYHRIKGLRNQYISDFVYKTEHLKQVGGFYKMKLAWASDDITSYIASMEYGIVHTQEILFKYRSSPLTISSSGNIDLKLVAIEEEKEWLKSFIENCNPKSEFDAKRKIEIANYVSRYIQKKKMYTLSTGMNNKNILKGNFQLILKAKKNKISLKEFFYINFLSLVAKCK